MTFSPPPQPSRRRALSALALAAWAGLVAAGGLVLAMVLRMVGSGPAAGPRAPVPLGVPQGLSPGQVREKDGVALVRDAKGLLALDLTCPHLGCRPAWHAGQKRFLCPCHGSAFDLTGRRLVGPAARGLTPLKLEQDSSGQIWARPGQEASPGQRLPVKEEVS